jgi:methionyl-tRNA formyltransferase
MYMKVLFLGKIDSPVIEILRGSGDEVVQTEEKLSLSFLEEEKFDFLVSHGYWHILKKEMLTIFPDRAINLHISFLPWNRGIAPNLWSWIENTPKGVTIHHIDEGVDTGDIILQEEVIMSLDETLCTSYGKLQSAICSLFERNWKSIRGGKIGRQPQSGVGSLHTLKERKALELFLPEGWDTPVCKLPSIALLYNESIQKNNPSS